MKIARLLLVFLALTATVVSAAPKSPKGRPGGSGSALPSQTDQEPYWFYCYSDPGTTYYCYDDLETCQWACAEVCGGTCDWEYEAN